MDEVFKDIVEMLETNGFIMLNENLKYPSICSNGSIAWAIIGF